MAEARPRGDWPLMLGLVTVVLVVSGYVAMAPPAAVYAIAPDRALVDFARYGSRKVRVYGVVVPGSLHRRLRKCGIGVQLVSRLTKASQPLHVRYEGCSLPEALCDLSGQASSPSPEQQEAGFEGQLVQRNGRVELEAEAVILKCPGKYEPPDMAAFCARYRPGDYCPVCAHVVNAHVGAETLAPADVGRPD